MDWPDANASVSSFWLRDRLPDFGAAVGALIDEVDLRYAPMGLNLPDVHRKQSNAAGAHNRSCLDFAMLDIGWHVGSPSQQKRGEPQPRANFISWESCLPHQLFRTDAERPHIVRVCGIPVTLDAQVDLTRISDSCGLPPDP